MYDILLGVSEDIKFVSICAWCDAEKKLTKEYICKGYRTSHGICLQHKNEVLEEYKKSLTKL